MALQLEFSVRHEVKWHLSFSLFRRRIMKKELVWICSDLPVLLTVSGRLLHVFNRYPVDLSDPHKKYKYNMLLDTFGYDKNKTFIFKKIIRLDNISFWQTLCGRC